ncbi:MAG: pilus assembly protein [Afipia sp.]|nr:pilus assembly protein [Afipia sp.]
MTKIASIKFWMNLQGHIARLKRDSSGMAAIEFVFIVPLMLVIFFGTIELSNGVAADRKVTITARTLSDLVSQNTNVTNLNITNFFTMGSAIMTPYSGSPMTLRVSAVSISSTGVATIAWSDGQGIAGRTVGSTVTVPSGLIVNSTQLIWSEIAYTYTPAVGYVMKSAVTLTDQCYTRPRQSTSVTRSAS